jgi:hypothetical protein
MSARRVTTVTVPVQVRSGVAFEAYRDRTPLLTIWATRPALLVTLTLPEQIEPGHVRFAPSSPSRPPPTRPRSNAATWPCSGHRHPRR